MTSTKKVKVAGRKNKKHVHSESNWKTYTGSSTYVNEDIDTFGKDNFNFTITEWVCTAGELHSREIELLVENRCLDRGNLLGDGERAWYNARIDSQLFLTPVFHPDSTRKK